MGYPILSSLSLPCFPGHTFLKPLHVSSNSVVNSSNLVTKIYFPRLLIPLAASIAPVVDLVFSFLLLLVLMVWYKITPTWGLLALPLFLGLAIMTALAVGLWSSAINVRYRDVGNIIPFLSQVWMYASPVAYPVSMVPEKWRTALQPEPDGRGDRRFSLGPSRKEKSRFYADGSERGRCVALTCRWTVYFKKMEQTFADVI